jgi:competence protein ComEA
MKTKMVIVVIIMVLSAYWFYPKEEDEIFVEHGKEQLTMIKIDIRGAVDFPGTYHVFKPITVGEALLFAGEISENADLTTINLSELITSNHQIIILEKDQVIDDVIVKINVNKASFKELITIPGMTETRAASLIIYRETYGDFKHLDDLIHVKYIGAATLEKIKPYLTL